jgi:hypothetical protein
MDSGLNCEKSARRRSMRKDERRAYLDNAGGRNARFIRADNRAARRPIQ